MFLGPSIGGILIDNFGLQAAALIFSVLFCLTLTSDFKELLNLRLLGKQEFGKIAYCKKLSILIVIVQF